MEAISLVLLPGLDGTGKLFDPLISNLPDWIQPIVVSYPKDTDDRGLIASRSAWVDIVKFETFPVYPAGDTKKALIK